MKRLLTVLLVIAATTAHAQRMIEFTIDPTRQNVPISPYIYGINWVHGGEDLHADWNLGSRRLGGNRLSSYNWEINASNSGNDCDAGCRNQNDDWLTYQLPAADQGLPALLPRRFHEDSKTLGCYSLVQLQAAGYVAGDRNEAAGPLPPAPSPRWKEVKILKGAPLAPEPDLNDAYVYIDEQVKYLVTTLGSSLHGGIQGYAIDNEPGLWYSSHPHLRGLSYNNADEVTQAENSDPNLVKSGKAKCTELIQKSIDMATAVKSLDPDAQVIGPAFWGFLDYTSLQNAPDWPAYRGQYGTYMAMYLDKMHAASQTAGKRLLDVVDVHWYPQMDETPENIIQAPRSLWDPTYKENSWITNDVLGAPINLIPRLNTIISDNNPGTELGITEFRFGDADNGDHYYSGIAVADALGIFGKYKVFMAQYHPTDLDAPIEGYVAAAYKIFRNYDGARSTFGSVSIPASTGDVALSSIYASLDPADASKLHIIAINKSATDPLDAHFSVAGATQFSSARVYGFDNLSSAITERAGVASILGNAFTYRIPPLTVVHMVLQRSQSGVDVSREDASAIALREVVPNPLAREGSIAFSLPRAAHATLKLFNALGREIATLSDGNYEAGEHTARIDAAGLAAGTYFCRLESGGVVREAAVRVVR